MGDDLSGASASVQDEDGSIPLPLSDNVQAGFIKAIDRGSVHKICSGQVVLTLATAVKELVENSIDAGATSVEIKLKEYGSELIEVIDNGSGVEESNFEGLTLKHHTSKLQDFSDLINVETFGFRGEALSSLCALSQLSVTTRHKSASVGHKLDFDYHGKLTSKSPCARQNGTTVTLQNLFSTLPVRHKEFQRHLKKEFSKMIQVLNAYCIISTGVRLSCSNQNGKGKRNIVVSTNGNSSLRENVSNIFGPKQLQSLLEFQQIKPTDDICEELGLKIPEQFHIMYKVTGYVSSCCHGQGRSSTDRQFYFINQRPCDPTKVSKLVNEVYHMYNRHQYPFVALDIQLEKDHVDVNVTPDKRQIFVQEEKLLLAIIKSSLIKMFEPIHSIYQVNPVPASAGTMLTSMFRKADSSNAEGEIDDRSEEVEKTQLNRRKSSITSTLAKLKRSFSSAFCKNEETSNVSSTPSPEKQTSKQRRLDGFLSVSRSPGLGSSVSSSPQSDRSGDVGDRLTPDESGFSSSQDLVSGESQASNTSPVICQANAELAVVLIAESEGTECTVPAYRIIKETERLKKSDISVEHVAVNADELSCEEHKMAPVNSFTSADGTPRKLQNPSLTVTGQVKMDETSSDNPCQSKDVFFHRSSSNTEDLRQREVVNNDTPGSSRNSSALKGKNDTEDVTRTLLKYDDEDKVHKREVRIAFSMQMLYDRSSQKGKGKTNEQFCRIFRAKISPTDNQSAEEELEREIKKEMFAEMEILGQFNLGFIIARLKDDLFIIDQHATDEKYNFEMLQRNTVIQSQRLIQPLPLELTASNEIILMDNIEIFKKNGFDFSVDENANPTQRIKLISTPVSKNWTFGKEDIEEMLFMLSESPGVSCRPSRVRQMFASRSCRKAVMIGTALDMAEMRKLVNHMGEIEQPWNCPHGRPTMRHLINLRMIQR